MNLVIDNSECRLEGLGMEDHKRLKEVLSYTLNPQAAYFSGGYGPKKQSLLSNKGVFPTGLLPRVLLFFKDNKIKVLLIDNRRVPKSNPRMFKLKLED